MEYKEKLIEIYIGKQFVIELSQIKEKKLKEEDFEV